MSCKTARSIACGLITPHGDWKLRKSARICPSWTTHYPSWGLETRRMCARLRACRTSHYPSWDWKLATTQGWRDAVSVSLPLMGIGNNCVRSQPVESPQLITPHGDWKPLLSATCPASEKRSLPLMGIGNPCLAQAERQEPVRLITPHGDWKQGKRATVRTECLCSLPLMGIGNLSPAAPPLLSTVSSLPLMGIGNIQTYAAEQPEPQLITPHGDWKHLAASIRPVVKSYSLPLMGIGNPVRRSCAAPAAAHYPSWGLETFQMSRASCASPISLPLMGIGNPLYSADFTY